MDGDCTHAKGLLTKSRSFHILPLITRLCVLVAFILLQGWAPILGLLNPTPSIPSSLNTQWLSVAGAQTSPLVCDVDADNDIDRDDVKVIFDARGLVVEPGDPRDTNGDGVITVNDGRACVLQCTNPKCEIVDPTLAPTADAGENQTVEVGDKVTLDGSGSSDPNNPPLSLTFMWKITEKPSGSSAELTNPNDIMSTFFVDVKGKYTIELIVNNGVQSSTPDTMMVFIDNIPPVADAGPDQSMVLVGQKITLDGSASFDMDGDPLTFKWSVIDEPSLGACELNDDTLVRPMYFANEVGGCTFELVVNDGEFDSTNCENDRCRVTIATNSKPVSVAKVQNPGDFNEGDTVKLDGSDSFDVDGDLLSFMWVLNKPAESKALLDDPNAVMPEFVVDIEGTYSVQLVVNDGNRDSDPDGLEVNVNIIVIEEPPVAVCSLKDPASEIFVDSLVGLDGSQSFDPNNEPITFKWSITKQPDSSSAQLSDSTGSMPTITPDVPGMYMVQLIVSDGNSDSVEPCVVSFATGNRRPVADAGDNHSNVNVDEPVKLDGRGSMDPDKDPLTYKWSITTRPSGSNAELDDDEIVMPMFTPDKEGTYVVQLIVNDGELDSEAKTVVIMTNKGPVVTLTAHDTTASEIGLEAGAFTVTRSGGNQATFLDVLYAIEGTAGNASDYASIARNVRIPANETSATVTITPIADNLVEEAETVILTLAARTTYTIGTPATGTVTIADNEAVVTLTAHDTTASEIGLEAGAFTVTRSGGNQATFLDVLYAIEGTAGNASDYASIARNVRIPANETSATVTITPIADNLVEEAETVILTLAARTAYTIGTPATGTVTIADNEAVVTLTAHDTTASEIGLEAGAFTVTRSGGNQATFLDVLYAIEGTAGNASDYASIARNVRIPANETSATVTITPIADNLVEEAETVILTLAARTAYTIGTPATGTVTIADNEAVVTLTAHDTTASEIGLEAGAFTVTRSGGNQATFLDVLYAIEGTAGNASDYASIARNVRIPANETSATVAITPIADNLVEGAETVILTLAARTTYTIGTPATGTVTIADNQAVVTLTAHDTTASEIGLEAGAFTVTRSGGNQATFLDVFYAIEGTAGNRFDYTGIAGGIRIPANETSATVAITPIADNLVEGAETVILTLAARTTYTIGTPATGTVTIADNQAVVTLTAHDTTASEIGLEAGAFTVTRSGGNQATFLDVFYAIEGTARNRFDYTFIGSSVRIPANETSATVTITPIADNLVEGAETVILTLAARTTYTIGTPETGTVTIADSEAVVTLTAHDTTASEIGLEAGAFTVTRSGGNQATFLDVFYAIEGTARNRFDYTGIAGGIRIPANETSATVAITPVADNLVEGAETVILTLAARTTYTIGTPATGTVMIADSN